MNFITPINRNRVLCCLLGTSGLLLSCGTEKEASHQLRLPTSRELVIPIDQLVLSTIVNGVRGSDIRRQNGSDDFWPVNITLANNFTNTIVFQWYRSLGVCRNGRVFVAEAIIDIPMSNGNSDLSELNSISYQTIGGAFDDDGDGVENIEDVDPCPPLQEPELVALPGGCFQMGSPSFENGRGRDEAQHQACVDSFEIGKYEISIEQFAAFVCETKYEHQGSRDKYTGACNLGPSDKISMSGRRPVVGVTWYDAIAYVKWLSEKFNKKYRLPTEAEWEYMARAGSDTAFSTGSEITHDQAIYTDTGSDIPSQMCSITDSVVGNAEPVGTFSPNNWDLYDVHGNVGEWTCSEYDQKYSKKERSCSEGNTKYKVVRGGSWRDYASCLRAANRHSELPDTAASWIGFRVAVEHTH